MAHTDSNRTPARKARDLTRRQIRTAKLQTTTTDWTALAAELQATVAK